MLLDLEHRTVRVTVVRNPRARHYRLSIDPQGLVRLVIPRGGSLDDALRFARSKARWIQRVLALTLTEGRAPQAGLLDQSRVLLHGDPAEFSISRNDGTRVIVAIGDLRQGFRSRECDPRRLLTCALWLHARRTLPGRARELAREHGCEIGRVTIRNQRSRWGSCSANGNISLNWRLVQMPATVSDYVIIHELMHRRAMNHSRTFWRHVERACPDFEEAEEWLKANRGLLLP